MNGDTAQQVGLGCLGSAVAGLLFTVAWYLSDILAVLIQIRDAMP